MDPPPHNSGNARKKTFFSIEVFPYAYAWTKAFLSCTVSNICCWRGSISFRFPIYAERTRGKNMSGDFSCIRFLRYYRAEPLHQHHCQHWHFVELSNAQNSDFNVHKKRSMLTKLPGFLKQKWDVPHNEWTAQSNICKGCGDRRYCKSHLEFEFALTVAPSDGRRKFAVFFFFKRRYKIWFTSYCKILLCIFSV